MEYLDGADLARVIEKAGPLPLNIGLIIASDIAKALGYAHEHGIVHRDISQLFLKGDELVSIELRDVKEGQSVSIRIKGEVERTITGKVRLDTEAEIEYCKSGNILNYTLSKM